MRFLRPSSEPAWIFLRYVPFGGAEMLFTSLWCGCSIPSFSTDEECYLHIVEFYFLDDLLCTWSGCYVVLETGGEKAGCAERYRVRFFKEPVDGTIEPECEAKADHSGESVAYRSSELSSLADTSSVIQLST